MCEHYTIDLFKKGDIWFASAKEKESGEIVGGSVGVTSDNDKSIKEAIEGVIICIKSNRDTRLLKAWSKKYPEYKPYFDIEDKKWHIPYLNSGAGGLGGVGNFSHSSLSGVIKLAKEYLCL